MVAEQKLKAIVIGVKNYTENHLRNLDWPDADAKSMKETLEAFPNCSDCFLLTTDSPSEQKPTKSNIWKCINQVADTAVTDDIIIFYFSGHGAVIAGEPVILPMDYQKDSNVDFAIKIEDITFTLVKSKARFKLLLLDSCQSGAIREKSADNVHMDENAFAALKLPEGFVIISSCKNNEKSHELGEIQHGIFTYHLLDGLRCNAADKDGLITVNSLYDYIYKKTSYMAYKIDCIQNPLFRVNYSGPPLILRKCPTPSLTVTSEQISPIVGLQHLTDEIENESELINWLIDKSYGEFELLLTNSKINRAINRLISDNYDEPRFQAVGKDIKCSVREYFSEIATDKTQNAIYFVTGESGVGKSTVLTNIFKDLRDAYSAKKISIIPIFISLHNTNTFDLNAEKIIYNLIKKHKIKCNRNIKENLIKNVSFVFIMDAIDEKSQILSLERLREAFQNVAIKNLYIISSRQNFYELLNPSNVNCIITLKNMDKNAITTYCNKVFSNNQVDTKTAQKIKKMVLRHEFFSNPLILSLFLITVIENPHNLEITELDISILFKKIVRSILLREKSGNRFSVSIENAERILEETAFQTYKTYHEKKLNTYQNLLSAVQEKCPSAKGEVEEIIGNFVMVASVDSSYRFVHEKFMEYFVARTFCERLINGDDAPKLLGIFFSYELHEFLHLMFNEYNQKVIYEKLVALYHCDMLNNNTLFATFILHLRRTRQDKDIYKFVKNILENALDVNVYVEWLLYKTLLVTGNDSDEEIYYNRVSKEPFDTLSRGAYMVYYGDEPRDNTLPHYDDGTKEWAKCFEAFKRHYKKSHTIRQYKRMMRSDFLAMRQFISERQKVKPEVVKFLSSIKKELQNDSSPLGKKVFAEYGELCKIVQKLGSSSKRVGKGQVSSDGDWLHGTPEEGHDKFRKNQTVSPLEIANSKKDTCVNYDGNCENSSAKEMDSSKVIETEHSVLPKRTEVYISYEQNEHKRVAKYVEDLTTFLQQLNSGYGIKIWHRGLINSGEWKKEIQTHMSVARVAILMLSPNFINSDFIRNHELPDLFQAANVGVVTIIPVPVMHIRIEDTKINCKDGHTISLVDYKPICDVTKPLITMAESERQNIYGKIYDEIKRRFVSVKYAETCKVGVTSRKTDSTILQLIDCGTEGTKLPADDALSSNTNTVVAEKVSNTLSACSTSVDNRLQNSDVGKRHETNAVSTDSKVEKVTHGNTFVMSNKKDVPSLFTSEIEHIILKQMDVKLDEKHPNISPILLSGGLSNSQVFLIKIPSESKNLTGPHIIKLTKNDDNLRVSAEEENRRCQNIFTQCNNEFKGHLVNSNVYYHNGVQIIRSECGVRSRRYSKNLCDIQLDKQVTYVEKISYDLLAKWNKDCKVDGDVVSFFSTLLSEITDNGNKFSQLVNLLLVNSQRKAIRFPFSDTLYPNPYYYMTHITELMDMINKDGKVQFISGKTHGDLHVQNIICDSGGDDYRYVLIDYTDYNSQSFVLYDHANLEGHNYNRILINETPKEWEEQLTLIEQRLDTILTSDTGNYFDRHFTYKSEFLKFRNAICAGITKWQRAEYSNNFDDIEIQFACARIAAGIRGFCVMSEISLTDEIRQKLRSQSGTSMITGIEMTCSSPFENLEVCVLLFYYTTVCLNNLLRNILKYDNWRFCDSYAELNVDYAPISDGSRKLIWSPKKNGIT